jgi:hypothetical protein
MLSTNYYGALRDKYCAARQILRRATNIAARYKYCGALHLQT